MSLVWENFDEKNKSLISSATTSSSATTTNIYVDTQNSTPNVSELNSHNMQLNEYLSQLSLPPKTAISIEKIGNCEVVGADNTKNKYEVVTTPQTINGLHIEKQHSTLLP